MTTNRLVLMLLASVISWTSAVECVADPPPACRVWRRGVPRGAIRLHSGLATPEKGVSTTVHAGATVYIVLTNHNNIHAPAMSLVVSEGRYARRTRIERGVVCRVDAMIPPLTSVTYSTSALSERPIPRNIDVDIPHAESAAIGVQIWGDPPPPRDDERMRQPQGRTRSPASVQRPNWMMEVWNIDDRIDLYVNNRKKADCGFNGKCSWNLNSYLAPGRNNVELRLHNVGGPYRWAYKLSRDGRSFRNQSCGDPKESCSRRGGPYAVGKGKFTKGILSTHIDY